MSWWRDLLYGPEPGSIIRAGADVPPTSPVPLLGSETSQPPGLPPTMLQLIDQAVDERTALFGLTDALRLPSVVRAVQLLASTVAQFSPVAYRDDVALEAQPRILRRPTPFGSRYAFLYSTTYALLAGDANADKAGNAFWYVTDRDDERQPRAVIGLPGSEVQVDWDARRFQRVYAWRGRQLDVADVIHVELGRKPGALLGCSPLAEGLEALAGVAAAEAYARAWFLTGGVPSVTLRVTNKATLTEAEARTLQAQWIAGHPPGMPAVLSAGIEDSYPAVNPESSQLQAARDYGNTVVARLLGIPAPLLHVSTSGATITYTNTAAALEELVRATIGPTYMPPLEAALSDLVPRTQAVRLETRELLRMDIATRFGIYDQGIASGMFTAEDARAFEGWRRTGPLTGQLFAPVPAPPPAPSPDLVPVA